VVFVTVRDSILQKQKQNCCFAFVFATRLETALDHLERASIVGLTNEGFENFKLAFEEFVFHFILITREFSRGGLQAGFRKREHQKTGI
jgi:hypothetical protein